MPAAGGAPTHNISRSLSERLDVPRRRFQVATPRGEPVIYRRDLVKAIDDVPVGQPEITGGAFAASSRSRSASVER